MVTLFNRTIVLALMFISSQLTQAAGSHGGSHGSADDIGQPAKGDPSRTIEVIMYDNYYSMDSLNIKEGETVRFVIRNEGQLVHEFNIGTEKMHAAHEPEMLMMVQHGVLKPDSIDREAAKAMEKSMGHGSHDEPNSSLLEPGKSGEIVWTFPKHPKEEIQFACNVPGHYAAGMVGIVNLVH
jgi:uncharacterized cupredoxin-like copper-binding protein